MNLERVCRRLAAGRSHRRVTAGTPARRGPTFVCARRRGLRSMSGHPAYAWGNPPTLRRSSFPRRALRPAGGPIPKRTWGCAPRPPNAKLRLDTNDAKASSVRRRRYALKVPAAHFILGPAGTELNAPAAPYKRRLIPLRECEAFPGGANGAPARSQNLVGRGGCTTAGRAARSKA